MTIGVRTGTGLYGQCRICNNSSNLVFLTFPKKKIMVYFSNKKFIILKIIRKYKHMTYNNYMNDDKTAVLYSYHTTCSAILLATQS